MVDFDVEDGSDCSYDVLTIRPDVNPALIDDYVLTLCGNSWKGESFILNGAGATLEFKTNEIFSRRGFLLALEVLLLAIMVKVCFSADWRHSS